MKKIWTRFLALGCMLACMLTLTLYSARTEAASLDDNEENMSYILDQVFGLLRNDANINQFLSMDDTKLDTNLNGTGLSAKVLKDGLRAFQDIKKECGDYQAKGFYDFSESNDKVTMNTTIRCKDHNANVKVLYDKNYNITSITFARQSVFAELIEKAGTGGIIGAGIVVILLGLIIGFALGKRNQNTQEDSTVILDNNHASSAVNVVQNVDSTELIAVITAAVAASMGTTSADGFVVRSIKKRRR